MNARRGHFLAAAPSWYYLGAVSEVLTDYFVWLEELLNLHRPNL